MELNLLHCETPAYYLLEYLVKALPVIPDEINI